MEEKKSDLLIWWTQLTKDNNLSKAHQYIKKKNALMVEFMDNNDFGELRCEWPVEILYHATK